MGCVDDVINVLGYCFGMMEIELVLVSYFVVVEVVVVGWFDDFKGEGIVVFVILEVGCEGDDVLVNELCVYVGMEIGLIVWLDEICCSDVFFKICSGKIMCWILWVLVVGQEVIGDISILEDCFVLDCFRV